MSNSFIAYTRVSTARQGTEGVSLIEQQKVISDYASKHHFRIVDWYEERCSASRRGRPIFDQMLERLQTEGGQCGLILHKVERSSAAQCGRPVFDQVMKRLADEGGRFGLILHKVDRGVRNLRDWASIGEAIDVGVDVRFAHDDFDLTTRGGRLAADIQAVIAADYIRNLREEVQKGVQGRLRQGLYPLRAPRGYLDCGGGRVKMPDPIIAPLIIAAFERYATGRYSYRTLAEELATQGLRKADGNPLRPDMIARILRNPFYIGKMRFAGKQHQGIHQPLITPDLFRVVQRKLARRSRPKCARHRFRYQGQLHCKRCMRTLTGERQRQYVYYRCHHGCGVSVREDRVSAKSPKYTIEKTKKLKAFSMFESL